MIDADLLLGELNKIIGLPLRYAGRASDLIWFGFGDLIKKEFKV